jgi:hypothetical protein
MDEKQPTFETYAQYRAEPVPADVYTPERWRTTNIQIITGAKSPGSLKIIAVDLDGDEARETFRRMCRDHKLSTKRLWVSSSPSGGKHCYFSVPAGVSEVPTRMIWGVCDTYGRAGRPEWKKHREIKILGDGALVVAPPSVHVDYRERKERYRFEPGFSPRDFAAPDEAPGWLLEMPSYQLPRLVTQRQREHWRRAAGFIDESMDFDALQDRIPPGVKIGMASEWGLEFAGSVPSSGWANCHSVDGNDSRPSGGFHVDTGRYKDHRTGQCISFFQLGVSLGKFKSVSECAEWCKSQVFLDPGKS